MNDLPMIRKAQLSDIIALKDLVNSGYRGDISRQGWTTEADLLDGTRIDEAALIASILNKHIEIFVYINEACEIKGCVCLELHFPVLYLGMLTVSPELQNQGIGKVLFNHSVAYAESSDFTSIEITVISSRSELIAWYERKGFVSTGEKKAFPDDPRFGIPKKELEFIVMEKIIG